MRDFLFDREDVSDFPVEAVAPELRFARNIDQFGLDVQGVAALEDLPVSNARTLSCRPTFLTSTSWPL